MASASPVTGPLEPKGDGDEEMTTSWVYILVLAGKGAVWASVAFEIFAVDSNTEPELRNT